MPAPVTAATSAGKKEEARGQDAGQSETLLARLERRRKRKRGEDVPEPGGVGKEGDEVTVAELVAHFRLTKFADALEEMGLEHVDDFDYLQETDLEKAGIPTIPRRKLLEALGAGSWRGGEAPQAPKLELPSSCPPPVAAAPPVPVLPLPSVAPKLEVASSSLSPKLKLETKAEEEPPKMALPTPSDTGVVDAQVQPPAPAKSDDSSSSSSEEEEKPPREDGGKSAKGSSDCDRTRAASSSRGSRPASPEPAKKVENSEQSEQPEKEQPEKAERQASREPAKPAKPANEAPRKASASEATARVLKNPKNELFQLLDRVRDRIEDFSEANQLDQQTKTQLQGMPPRVALRVMGLLGGGNQFLMIGVRRAGAAVLSRSRQALREEANPRTAMSARPYEDWPRLLDAFALANHSNESVCEALRGLNRQQALYVMGFTSELQFCIPMDQEGVDDEIMTRVKEAKEEISSRPTPAPRFPRPAHVKTKSFLPPLANVRATGSRPAAGGRDDSRSRSPGKRGTVYMLRDAATPRSPSPPWSRAAAAAAARRKSPSRSPLPKSGKASRSRSSGSGSSGSSGSSKRRRRRQQSRRRSGSRSQGSQRSPPPPRRGRSRSAERSRSRSRSRGSASRNDKSLSPGRRRSRSASRNRRRDRDCSPDDRQEKIFSEWKYHLETFSSINNLENTTRQILSRARKEDVLRAIGLIGGENSFLLKSVRNPDGVVLKRLTQIQEGKNPRDTIPYAGHQRLAEDFICVNDFDQRGIEAVRRLPKDELLHVPRPCCGPSSSPRIILPAVSAVCR
eukprot:TRINITY_DN5613_c0_g1_i1.p1 TRINITY_DN5613_c0_g1~~TRINITY_DN5613_c0_g1_i1.p1  ORF type:complete len:818 (+),score=164.19 TRINITY_DN5613_c0_g1_i1:73-2454(+)